MGWTQQYSGDGTDLPSVALAQICILTSGRILWVGDSEPGSLKVCYYSDDDGETWTQGGGGVAYGNPGWIPSGAFALSSIGSTAILNTTGGIYTSTNGVTWTATIVGNPTGYSTYASSTIVPRSARRIAFGGYMWEVFSKDSALHIAKTDGSSWAVASTLPTAQGYGSTTWALGTDGSYLYIFDVINGGGSGAYVYRSEDGATWTEVSDSITTTDMIHYSACAIADFVARIRYELTDESDELFYVEVSVDGVNWSDQTPYTATDATNATIAGDGMNLYVYITTDDGCEFWLGDMDGLVPNEIPFYDQACTPISKARDVTETLPVDFGPALIIDFDTGRFFCADDFNFSCFFQVSGECSQEGQFPSRVFAGGTDGYLYEVLVDGYVGNGAPMSRLLWPIGNGSSATVINIDIATAGSFLPVGMLDDLPCVIKYADGTEAEATISTNTNSTITLNAALDTAPSNGDEIHVAPCECVVLWPEFTTQMPSSIKAAKMKVMNRQPEEQELSFEVYNEDSDGNLDLSAAASTTEFDASDLRKLRGVLPLAPNSGETSACALRFSPVGGGLLSITNVSLEQFVCPGDQGR